jgi:tRNA(Ile)-lysidine synthase
VVRPRGRLTVSGPDPAVAAIRLAVRGSLKDLEGSGARVLVACSGGRDSLALAAGLAFVAPALGIQAGAVVVDHGLQEGSAAIARRAAAQCRDLGLDPVSIVTALVPGGRVTEAAARDGRYGALEGAAAADGAAAVLLGHTMDDQAETVLLAMGRGSGPTALSGMAPRRGVFRRPLLAIRRSQTAQACAAQGIGFWDDPSNEPGGPMGSARAQMRAVVIPALEAALGPGVTPALARTASAVRKDAGYLDRAARTVLDQARVDGSLDATVLADAPPALRHRALKEAALDWGATPGALSSAHIDALDRLVADWHGQGGAALPGGIEVSRECGKLEARPTVKDPSKEQPGGCRRHGARPQEHPVDHGTDR